MRLCLVFGLFALVACGAEQARTVTDDGSTSEDPDAPATADVPPAEDTSPPGEDAGRVNDDAGPSGTDEGSTPEDGGSVKDVATTPDEGRPQPDTKPAEPRTKIMGCEGLEFMLPPGYTNMRIEPANPSVVVDASDSAKINFKVVGTLIGGADKELDEAIFLVSTTQVGSLGGSGQFKSTEGHGGVAPIKALIGEGCIETTVTVTTVFHELIGNDPPQPEWFDGAGEPAVNPASPVLVYPLDNAAWPRNLPPMVVQWTYDFGGASTVFRIDFSAPHAQVRLYGRHDDFKFKDKQFTVAVPVEAWSKIQTMVGGSPHQVQVVAGVDVGMGVAGLVGSVPHAVHFTQDIFGGAVYYWNTQAKGIKVLDLATKVPTVEKVPIPGGCHGCHATSPDGTTIAVSFVSKWTMKLHNVEDGLEADWLHPDAKAFFAQGYALYPAFSEAYWSSEEKHIVVSKYIKAAAGKPSSQHIFSIDLLNGTINQMTNDTQGLEPGQLFPAFSRNGTEVVFATAEQGKTISAKDNTQLWRMKYEGGLGGAPVPLEGAAKPELLQYYPAFTPDDLYVVFNQATADTQDCAAVGGKGGPGSGGTYDNCHADLWIVPHEGGEAVRLDAASGPKESMFANSWPSMSDKVAGKHYWVAFSSRRPYGVIHTKDTQIGTSKGMNPQIWVSAVDPGKIGEEDDPSFAPLWLPGQDLDGGNHIGQWSVRN